MDGIIHNLYVWRSKVEENSSQDLPQMSQDFSISQPQFSQLYQKVDVELPHIMYTYSCRLNKKYSRYVEKNHFECRSLKHDTKSE